ncbi:DUF2716 domain-containing protein [Actinospica durhamensis]|uniref:DUF2716 domain-containing protein n=1 Tax=Actinospica durhamensis TaxID=1508375 RepID=A0A941ISQ7_9ACTN|nr:DUF2716 domain-containing protein [Actinospica durhamensis]MBR7838799.1 DUF2716 domain-containing protein [Actinospica durhamensis]
MGLGAGELLAAHDRSLRGHVPVPARFGTVVEHIGPLILTHYGTHCTVDHRALDAGDSASAARLTESVQESAAARVEPVEWRVFAHDAAASHLSAVLDAAGFTVGGERSVLIGEVTELDFPQPQAEWKVESVRWDEPQVLQALDLSARSGPHRVPLAAWYELGSAPYWDVDVRVLTRAGKVAAACWLENVRGTEFVTLGGLTAARPELLARLPLWRFRLPAKRFLVADADADTDTDGYADGEVRSVLLSAGLREVTSVRSHRWTPPGEPATSVPARRSRHDADTRRIAKRGEARIGFDYAGGSGRYNPPMDSRRWFYGMLDGPDDPAIAAVEGVIERGLRACVRPGAWVYECRPYLNGWEFDPHRVGGPGQLPWPGCAVADSEFQFLTTADARLGTFGHYVEQTLVVFGDGLLAQVADDLDRILGGGSWAFG